MATAARAAAAAVSSFTPSMHSLKCTHSASWSSDPLLRVAPTRALAPMSHSCSAEPLSLGLLSRRWRALRVSSVSVAQEEASATASAELAPAVEEIMEKEGEGEDQEAPLNTKLYFGNLPYSVDSAQLAGLIQSYGVPELVEVLYDRETGRSRGFAFVTMSSIEDCNAVIENLDGSEFLGRILRVNFSDKPKPKDPLYPETEYKLFVGNLSWSVTSESLTQAFQECGKVVGARVLYDGESGMSRGYGFVCYSNKDEMESALKSLDGVELEGRAMRVSIAQGKRQ